MNKIYLSLLLSSLFYVSFTSYLYKEEIKKVDKQEEEEVKKQEFRKCCQISKKTGKPSLERFAYSADFISDSSLKYSMTYPNRISFDIFKNRKFKRNYDNEKDFYSYNREHGFKR
jgi:hypothetical protein